MRSCCVRRDLCGPVAGYRPAARSGAHRGYGIGPRRHTGDHRRVVGAQERKDVVAVSRDRVVCLVSVYMRRTLHFRLNEQPAALKLDRKFFAVGAAFAHSSPRHLMLFFLQALRQIVELIEIAITDADGTAFAAMIDTDDQAERIG